MRNNPNLRQIVSKQDKGVFTGKQDKKRTLIGKIILAIINCYPVIGSWMYPKLFNKHTSVTWCVQYYVNDGFMQKSAVFLDCRFHVGLVIGIQFHIKKKKNEAKKKSLSRSSAYVSQWMYIYVHIFLFWMQFWFFFIIIYNNGIYRTLRHAEIVLNEIKEFCNTLYNHQQNPIQYDH